MTFCILIKFPHTQLLLVLGQNSNSLSQKHQGCNTISKEQPNSSKLMTYHEQAFLNNLQLLSKHFHLKME